MLTSQIPAVYTNSSSETRPAESFPCPSLANDANRTALSTPLNSTELGAHKNVTADNKCETQTENPSDADTNFDRLVKDILEEECENFICGYTSTVCSCGPECILYGDCCHEYLEKIFKGELHDKNATYQLLHRTAFLQSLVSDTTLTTELFILDHSKCIGHKDKLNSFWMINKCPKDYPDTETVNKCKGDYYGLDSIPVEWADASGRVWFFRNIFCAFCHGADAEMVEKWNAYVYCDKDYRPDILPTGNISLADLGPFCIVDFRSTHILTMSRRYQRKCFDSYVSESDCPHSSATMNFRILCDSYIYTVKISGFEYRNPHCAICETGTAGNSTVCPRNILGPDLKVPVSLQIMFDFDPNKGFIVQAFCNSNKDCLQSEVYDCITGKCRQLYCSENQIPHFGKCVVSNESVQANFWYEESLPRDLNSTDENLLYIEIDLFSSSALSVPKIITSLLTNLSSIEKIVRSNLIESSVDEKDEDVDQDKPDWEPQDTEMPVLTTSEYNEIDLPLDDSGFLKPDDDLIGFQGQEQNINKETNGPTGAHAFYSYTATVKLKQNSVLASIELIRVFKLSTAKSNGVIISNSIKMHTYTDLKNLLCSTGNLTFEFNVSHFNDMSEVKLMNLTSTISVSNFYWKLSDSSVEKNMFDVIAVCLSRYDVPKLKCNMTTYDENEVLFTNTGMHIQDGKSFYKHSEYVKVGKKVFVCVDTLSGNNYLRFFKQYSKFQRILSVVTSSVSVICLLLICLAHVAFSKLRNNHGLNISALSGTMLLVQAFILVENVPANETCLVLAAGLHFLMLKMFIWMNIIGFDMAITFHPKTLTKSRKDVCRFTKYCAFAFALPLLCISTCLTLDYFEANLKPGYGAGNICWLTSSISIIVFFIVPISVSIILNIILFALTLYSIQTTKAKSSVRTTSQNRTYCFVYFKLSIILGFTWSVGIIAAFVSVNWLWYVHIVLNGLQGLSLFLCTMVNARTIKVFKESTKVIVTFSDTLKSPSASATKE